MEPINAEMLSTIKIVIEQWDKNAGVWETGPARKIGAMIHVEVIKLVRMVVKKVEESEKNG